MLQGTGLFDVIARMQAAWLSSYLARVECVLMGARSKGGDLMNSELATIFDDTAWKQYRLGDTPNRIYFNQSSRVAAVVITRGQRNDFPLSKAALARVLEAEAKRELVDSAYIVLRGRDGTFCAAERADAVAKALADARPIEGPYGPYYWINEAFGDPKRLDEVPF